MKRCPKCGQTFPDNDLNFCLTDGTPLTEDESSSPTVVMPPTADYRKGTSPALVVVIGLLCLIVGGLAGGLLVYNYNKDNLNLRVDRPGATPTPVQSKPKTTPTSPVGPSPANSPGAAPVTQDSPGSDNSDEITPIGWDTQASGFTGETGRVYKFECPKGGTENGVYGSDIYTDYSSICTAAVHAGVIKLEDGGTVTLEYRPGRNIYGSTTRNGVKSYPASSAARSFVVR